MSLKSSVEECGEVVTQILHFNGGTKKTIKGIKTDTIEQSELTHYETVDGRRIYVNPNQLLLFEVFNDNSNYGK